MSQLPPTKLFGDTIDELITKVVSEPSYVSENECKLTVLLSSINLFCIFTACLLYFSLILYHTEGRNVPEQKRRRQEWQKLHREKITKVITHHPQRF
jgi:hypothetical protein